MTTGFVWHERYAWHDAGRASHDLWAEPYPAFDRPETKRRLYSLIEASGLGDKLVRIAPRLASREELLRFHTSEYVDRIEDLSAAGGGNAGEYAQFGPDGFVAASLAAGGCIAAVDAVLDGRVDNAYALVRPCGHHAEPARGRGFCIFGNVALAVHHARIARGVSRVGIIDWDVHHGNGTQLAFYRDPKVFTVSIHQDRYYPSDSGALEEIGDGDGRGYNLNLPLPPGCGHEVYLAAIDRVVLPAMRKFEPELIVVASGYDAAASDPLGRMLCYSETYRQMTHAVKLAAQRLCDGKLVICHEGGYSATYVPYCGLAVVEEIAGVRTKVRDPLADWYACIGGQALAPHQVAVIEHAAERISSADLMIESN